MASIIRGTTPVLKVRMPYALSDLSQLFITFQQNRETLFEKNKSDCFPIDNENETDHVFGFRLTQEETLSLNKSYALYAQVLIKTNDQVIRASKVFSDFDIEDRLKEEEI